jgi:hypothetical protein
VRSVRYLLPAPIKKPARKHALAVESEKGHDNLMVSWLSDTRRHKALELQR